MGIKTKVGRDLDTNEINPIQHAFFADKDTPVSTPGA